MVHHILILGGTAEARQLAGRLAARRDATLMLSLAGRTRNPAPQPVPMRSGGFGGAAGLAAYLRANAVDLLVDATHPYAAGISANAVAAAVSAGVPLVALRRPPWQQQAGDRWTRVADAAAAVVALGQAPRRVLVTLGRNEVAAFIAAPQHDYIFRSVDAIAPPLAVPMARYLTARGPFAEADERHLLLGCGCDAVVAKNSGGEASYGKIAAARGLGIEVVLLDRPPPLPLPGKASVQEAVSVEEAASVEEVLALIDHALARPVPRGV